MPAMILDIRAGDEAMSLTEASLILGMTRQSVYVMVLRGDLPARQLAGRYVTTREDVERAKATRDRTRMKRSTAGAEAQVT